MLSILQDTPNQLCFFLCRSAQCRIYTGHIKCVVSIVSTSHIQFCYFYCFQIMLLFLMFLHVTYNAVVSVKVTFISTRLLGYSYISVSNYPLTEFDIKTLSCKYINFMYRSYFQKTKNILVTVEVIDVIEQRSYSFACVFDICISSFTYFLI